MNLRVIKKYKGLIGQAVGCGGRVYKDWEGDVLCDVSDADAQELLSTKQFEDAGKVDRPVRMSRMKGADAQLQKEYTEAMNQVQFLRKSLEETTEALKAAQARIAELEAQSPAETPDAGESDEEASREDLMALSMAELLEYVDEADKAEASKLKKKSDLVDFIMGGEEE